MEVHRCKTLLTTTTRKHLRPWILMPSSGNESALKIIFLIIDFKFECTSSSTSFPGFSPIRPRRENLGTGLPCCYKMQTTELNVHIALTAYYSRQSLSRSLNKRRINGAAPRSWTSDTSWRTQTLPKLKTRSQNSKKRKTQFSNTLNRVPKLKEEKNPVLQHWRWRGGSSILCCEISPVGVFPCLPLSSLN